ncbi:uncharacterized protein [Epargyreus clarus]
MTTFIDDGLLEECLNKTITITDYEKIPIIDLDDIDATIEDPGCILDEPLTICEKTEEHTSSYGKQSCALPVRFFDINRNVSLLKKCRPISIKIVDCNIYPWYYKQLKYDTTNDMDTNKDKDRDRLKNALADFISFNSTDNEKNSSTNESNSGKIKLSSEQSLAVSKLREDIAEKINDINETYDLDTYGDEDINNVKSHESITDSLLYKMDKIINECHSDKNNVIVDPNDLKAYEAIAQTIVRNLDYGAVTGRNDKKLICNQKSEENTINVDTYVGDVELVGIMKNDDSGRTERNGKASEKRTTSPILPCTVRPKKKRKEKMTKPYTTPNTIFEKCNDPTRNCHKFVSANKVIPHYHYILPNSTSTYNSFNNNFNIIENSRVPQYNITRDTHPYYVQRNDIVNRTQPKQYTNNNKYPPISEPPPYNPLMRIETYANRVAYTSGLEYNPLTYNNPHLQYPPLRPTPSSRVRKPNVLKNNIHSNAYVPYPSPQLNYLDTYPQDNRCPVPCTTCLADPNVANIRGPGLSKENYRVFSQNSAPPLTTSSLHPRNEHVNTKTLLNPIQMTVAYVQKKKNYPLLTKLLDSERTSLITITENNINSTDIAYTHQFSGPPSSAPDTPNKVNLDALITVLAKKNCERFNLKEHNTHNFRHKKYTEPKMVKNPMHQFNTNQGETKLVNNISEKMIEPTQHDFEINIVASEIPRNINRYSPPILPIPTIKKGLEILSKLQPNVPNATSDGSSMNKINTKSHMDKSRKEYNEMNSMKRKRIVNSDEKICSKSRKISLEQYKQRKFELDSYVNSEGENITKMQNEDRNIQCHGIGMDISYLGCKS